MMCLRLPLTSTSGELRAATLRAVRYLVTGPAAVAALTQVRHTEQTADIIFCDCCMCFEMPEKISVVESQHTQCQVNLHQLLVRALDLHPDLLLVPAVGGGRHQDPRAMEQPAAAHPGRPGHHQGVPR